MFHAKGEKRHKVPPYYNAEDYANAHAQAGRRGFGTDGVLRMRQPPEE